MMKFWSISVEDAQLQPPTYILQSKGECFLSANTKLVGIDKAVKLTNEELAMKYRDAILTIMRRRHGEFVRLNICLLQIHSGVCDDQLVAARIAEDKFAPNLRPTAILSNVGIRPTNNI